MNASMSTPLPGARLRKALGLLALMPLILTAPTIALAQHAGGGSHGGGGGGHGFSGGGSHATSAPHFAGGQASAGGRMAAAPHFAPSNAGVRPGYNVAHATGYGARPVGPYTGGGNAVNHYVAPYNNGGSYARGGGYARGAPGGGYARGIAGRYIPGRAFNYHYWHGGYWHGGFWPGVYWGSNFAWFLPAIPAFAAAYWWNSVPYYYYNNVYYTYDSSQSGYVVTTPPPADESSAAAAPDTSYPDPASAGTSDTSSAPQDSAPVADGVANAGTGNLFAYPKNGQSEEQQTSDRQDCAQWATGQMRSDGSGSSMDYQRALTACLQGRGYSVD